MGSPEKSVSVVTDSGSSIRPEEEIAQELEVEIVPLEIKFFEGGKWVPYFDLEIPPDEFYRRLRDSERLPQTSGAVTGRMVETYERLSEKTQRIISIHITSKHSVAWESAGLAASIAREERPELLIEVVDSKNISLGTWFLADKAARMSQQGAGLEEIKETVLATIPKTGLLVVLSTLENIIKGGRVPVLAGYLGTLLDIKPVLGVIDGELQEVSKKRGVPRARKEMINRIQDEPGIARMAILHTNSLGVAKEVREAISVL